MKKIETAKQLKGKVKEEREKQKNLLPLWHWFMLRCTNYLCGSKFSTYYLLPFMHSNHGCSA